MTVIDQLSVLVGADISGLQSGLNRADGEVDGFASRIGGKLARLGGGMMLVTAPLVGGFIEGTQQAVKFNESITNSAAVLGLTADATKDLQSEILAIGGTARAGPQAVADAYYDVVGGVSDAANHIPILNAAIATSEAGAASLTGTTAALISVMNSYGYAANKATFASDVLTNIVGKGVGTMDEFASALPQVAGLAAANGVELDNLGASMAYITTKGYSASEASTQLKAVMTALLNPNEKMKAALKAMGVESGSAALEMYGLAGVTGRLQTALGGSTDAMAAAFGSVEALNGAIVLNNPGFEQFIANFEETTDGATAAARAIQLTSAAAKIDLARAGMSRLGITITSNLLPPLGTLAGMVSTVTNAFSDFLITNPLAADTIMDMALAAMVAGPAVGGIGLAMMALATPMIAVPVLVAATVAAITGLVSAFDNFIGFDTRIEDFGDGITRITTPIDRLGAALSTIQIGSTTVGAIASGVEQVVRDAMSNVGISPDDVAAIPGKVSSAISDAFSIDFGGFADITGAIQSELQGAINDIAGTQIDLTGVQSFVQQNFESIVNLVVNTAWIIFGGPVWAAIGIGQTIVSAIQNDFLGIRTMLEESGIAATVTDAFNNLKNTVSGIIQSIFGGGGQQQIISPAAFDMTGMMPGDAQNAGQSAVLGQIAQDLQSGISIIVQTGQLITEDIISGFQRLGTGIGEFIAGVSGAETGGLYEVARAILGFVGGLAVATAQFVGFGIGAVLTALGDALGPLGESVGLFITAVSRLGEGDIAGMLTALGGSVLKFGESIITVPISILDSLITKFNEIFNLNLPAVSEVIGDLGTTISNFITGTLDWWRQKFTEVGLSIQMLLEGPLKWLVDGVGLVGKLLAGPIETIRNAFDSAFKWIDTNVIQPFIGALGGILSIIGDILTEVGKLFDTGTIVQTDGGAGVQAIGDRWRANQGGGGGPTRDSGGRGRAGVAYMIGTGAQPEAFIPDSAGTFIPNFDRVLAGAPVAAGAGGANVTNHYNVNTFGPQSISELFDLLEQEKSRRGL